MKNILMVVTNNDNLGQSEIKTGVYLSEFLEPYKTFKKSGFGVDVASLLGGVAPVDPHSLSDFDSGQYEGILGNTLVLSTIDPQKYCAIFIVGGHGVMWDLPEDTTLDRIINNIYDRQGVVSSVCHGGGVLAKVKRADGDYLVKGKRVTGFSNAEESTVGADKFVPFLVEDAFDQAGANFEKADIFMPKIVEDGNIITGQNPSSSLELAVKVCDAIKRSLTKEAVAS